MRRIISIILILLLATPSNATTWFAQGSGNMSAITWQDASSNTLTWPPASGDVLCANGYSSIAIDTDVTCLRLSTTSEEEYGTAGGGFTVSAARTITASIVAGSTTCLAVSGTGYTLAILGDITGGNSGTGHHGLSCVSACTINVTGNIVGGSSTDSRGINIGNTTLNIVGDITGGSGGDGVYVDAASTVTVSNGTIIGGSVTSKRAIYQTASSSSCSTTLSNCVVYGGSAAQTFGVYNSGLGTIAVNNCNLIDSAYCCAVAGKYVYNPGSSNYIQHNTTSSTVKLATEPTAADLKSGIVCGSTTGTCSVPTADNVISGVATGATTGTYVEAAAADVKKDVTFGPSSSYTGTYEGGIPAGNIVSAQYVLTGHDNYTGGSAGTLTLPTIDYVLGSYGSWGVAGTGSTGTLTLPAAAQVKKGVAYGVGGNSNTGTFVAPPHTGKGAATR